MLLNELTFKCKYGNVACGVFFVFFSGLRSECQMTRLVYKSGQFCNRVCHPVFIRVIFLFSVCLVPALSFLSVSLKSPAACYWCLLQLIDFLSLSLSLCSTCSGDSRRTPSGRVEENHCCRRRTSARCSNPHRLLIMDTLLITGA